MKTQKREFSFVLSPFRVFVSGLKFLPKNYEDVYDLNQK